jgi:hypothetical protein
LHHPTPTREDVRVWAEKCAHRLGKTTTIEDVLRYWRPMLQARGLLGRGGRPPLEERHRLVAELRASWPRTRSGRLAPGFWPAAELRVADYEGNGAPAFPALRQWWIDHTAHCSAPPDAVDEPGAAGV